MSETCSKITALDLNKAGFGLLRESGRQYPMGVTLEGKGVQESRSDFKYNILKAQEGFILMCGRSIRPGRRLVRMNRELLTEVDSTKEVHRRQKWGQAAQEE